MKLLHIDAAITGEGSVSRQVAAAVVDRLRKTTPGLEVIHRDLAAAPLPHLTLAHLPGGHPIAAATGADASDPARTESQAALDEFLAADIVVIGAPMYNFTVPSQLKAWIDRILTPGQTFRYTASGPEGLAGGKRVIIALSRGGFYGAGAASEAFEHAEAYLRTVFGFIGVEPEFIVAEGVQVSPEHRETALAGALGQASGIGSRQAVAA